MRCLHLGPATTFPSLFASESEGRAEVALMGEPVNADAGGRLTHCLGGDCGLVGVVDGMTGSVGEGKD